MIKIPQQFPLPLLGIIFDFDGVIVDSEKHWAEVENPYLQQHISDWQNSEYDALIGKSLPEVHTFLRSRGLALSPEQYFADYEVMANQIYREIARPFGTTIKLLTWAKDRNIPCAISSSSKRSWINLALQANKLEHFFTHICSAQDPEIERGKPAPDVYLNSVAALEVHTDNIIAIEDSRNGVLAAKGAGLYCIGFRNGDNDAQDLTSADLIQADFTDLLLGLENIQ